MSHTKLVFALEKFQANISQSRRMNCVSEEARFVSTTHDTPHHVRLFALDTTEENHVSLYVQKCSNVAIRLRQFEFALPFPT